MLIEKSKDKDRIIDILVHSFSANKSVRTLCGDDEKRRRLLIEYAYNYCSAFGKVYLSNDRDACALVLFPDRKRTTLKTVFWDIKLLAKVVSLPKLFRVMRREAAINKFHPIHPIYYIWFLGVAPQAQGSGKGSELMDKMLADARLMARPVYLETSTAANLPFYRRHGLEVFHELALDYRIYMLNNRKDKGADY